MLPTIASKRVHVQLRCVQRFATSSSGLRLRSVEASLALLGGTLHFKSMLGYTCILTYLHI